MRFVILIQTFLLLLNTHTLQERDAQASFFCFLFDFLISIFILLDREPTANIAGSLDFLMETNCLQFYLSLSINMFYMLSEYQIASSAKP